MTIDQMVAHVESMSSRIRLQMVPVSAPGQCAICGNGKDEKGFVDPQLDFEFWGACIFCSVCVAEMAAIYGFITPDTYEDAIGDLQLTKFENNELKTKNAQLEKALEGLSGYFSNTNIISSVSSGLLIENNISEAQSVPESNPESVREPIQQPAQTDGAIIKSERAPSKPNSSTRFLDI